MKKITPWLHESAFTTPLSPACRMCAKGSKMVILVTGLCSTGCFYCPLSFKKSGTDRIFADEWELKNEGDTQKLIDEAKYIRAKGAGITGGDPLLVWKRVETYITLLKNTFGSSFHIHLYTSGLDHADHLQDLIDAGLDEVRFHPQVKYWVAMDNSPIKNALKDAIASEADVAIEIPAIPGTENDIVSLLSWADEQGVQWANLNELEFSEKNCDNFNKKGYVVKDDISAAVMGSQETALEVLKQMQYKDLAIGIHYCTVSFKDGVQLKNRIKRRARSIAKQYDIITEDGTLVKGVVYSIGTPLPSVAVFLKKTYNIPSSHLRIDIEKNRIEIASWVLEKIAPALTKKGYPCFIVEEYPTADRLEVERTPLP